MRHKWHRVWNFTPVIADIHKYAQNVRFYLNRSLNGPNI